MLIFRSIVINYNLACKDTTKIWNTQVFRLKNLNLFIFYGRNACYSYKSATVSSRWDGVAVSVSSKIQQIFIFFQIYKFFAKKINFA